MKVLEESQGLQQRRQVKRKERPVWIYGRCVIDDDDDGRSGDCRPRDGPKRQKSKRAKKPSGAGARRSGDGRRRRRFLAEPPMETEEEDELPKGQGG